MSASSTLKIGRTGYVVRIEGRGTWRESCAVHEFMVQSLTSEACSEVIDLFGCEHLDSTFLGTLVDLYKHFGGEPPRLLVAASPEARRRLLAPTHLDTFLRITRR